MNSHRVVNGLKEATCEVWLNVQEYNIELKNVLAVMIKGSKKPIYLIHSCRVDPKESK